MERYIFGGQLKSFCLRPSESVRCVCKRKWSLIVSDPTTIYFHLLKMPFARYFNKDEPSYLAARLVGFGSIQLCLQGNVAIPGAKIRFSNDFRNI